VRLRFPVSAPLPGAEGLGHVAVGDWAAELACSNCGGAEPEVLLWNGVIDTGYGSAKPERAVLLKGQGPW
jgi:hypothetical protein